MSASLHFKKSLITNVYASNISEIYISYFNDLNKCVIRNVKIAFGKNMLILCDKLMICNHTVWN